MKRSLIVAVCNWSCGGLAAACAAGSAGGQCQPQEQAKLIAPEPAAGDEFGWSVALGSNIAVIGARSDDHAAGLHAGAAYVFGRSGTPGNEVWNPQATLTASDAAENDQFGSSVALWSITAVVGAPLDDHVAGDAGSAYVFVQSGPPGSEVWTEQAKLTASDAAGGDKFGSSVAVSGHTAVVGAPLDDHAGGSDAGSAYVFLRIGHPGDEVWVEQAKLTTSDAAADDWFGSAVAISGDTVVIGAHLDDHAGGIDAGSAYVFVRTGGVWTQHVKLTALDAAAGDNFGGSVAVSGDTAVAGAPWNDHGPANTDEGAAYVFVRGGSLESPPGGDMWTQQTKLIASDASTLDAFGSCVALEGDVAVIGADSASYAGLDDAGAAYVFVRARDVWGNLWEEVWAEQAKLIASDAMAIDQLGGSVSVSDNRAVAGVIGDDHDDVNQAGSAYVFDLNCEFPCLADVEPEGGGDGQVDIDDLFAIIAAWGPCPMPCPPFCQADIDDDCDADIDDLFTVIGAWGPCK